MHGVDFMAVHGAGLIAVDIGGAVAKDVQSAVALDVLGAVVEGEQVEIFLSVEPDLLFVRFIFKAQLVKALRLVALGADHRAGFVGRQRIRRPVISG